MPWAMAAGAGASILGGVVGNLASQGDVDQANQAKQQALQQLMGVNAPTVDQMKVNLQHENVAGQLSPQAEQLVSQGPSAMQGVNTDPRLQQAQMNALNTMQQIGQGGFTQAQKVALQQAMNNNEASTQGRMGSIMQNMAARGMGGSGAELAAKLSASQAADQQNSMNALSTSGQANTNALNALSQAGSLGGSMQQQQFNQASAKANAADSIARFNAQNTQGLNQRNTNAQNAAQEYNLNNSQRVSDQNTGIANQQQMYNQGLYQQNYNNQMAKAQDIAGQDNSNAKWDMDNANRTAGMWSNIGGGVGKMFGGMAGGAGGSS